MNLGLVFHNSNQYSPFFNEKIWFFDQSEIFLKKSTSHVQINFIAELDPANITECATFSTPPHNFELHVSKINLEV